MDMNRIIGALLSGFACRLYAVALAIYMASHVARLLLDVSHRLASAF